MSELMCALIRASEKAANIARSCRQEEALFSLLIEEKKEGEKNKKFVTDFKTLADVLVQEVIKHDIGKEFPDLGNYIFGEESNEFTNGLGETIRVKVCNTEQDTEALLGTVLGGNGEAARSLACAAHLDVAVSNLGIAADKIPLDNLGVWVDPIDSTFQYIKGVEDSVPTGGVYSQGLQCVTVLIGVYNRHSGTPVMGVINQPFASLDDATQRWTGRYYWGISSGSYNINSLQLSTDSAVQPPDQQGAPLSVVLSTGEAASVKEAILQVCGGRPHYAAGAGYKSLCVVLGLVDLYVFSEDTTFRWDCCSPHAILRSMGGGMADLQECLRARREGRPEEQPELLYSQPIPGAMGPDRWANKGGLIAYRSQAHLQAVLEVLGPLSL
ncbi:inositol polyphosphate 1-phosphatase isoform X3 [Paramormyrops kingsleyae]|uniref:inositol-1,4-bisphosphate 1-phosphatase n=2 Tax=Paramormyrops kingsleyae TaxID=1676925 RepID=A0A3B3T1N5_9TELE|nr:inositol polyphosphate 1-phosphatase isoform X1 [Paramormyrops kingsleyae]XP_023665850.1 inositol polyphosphate 1-phosphatase isoform X1 [Paramormyrops kingsleyae]